MSMYYKQNCLKLNYLLTLLSCSQNFCPLKSWSPHAALKRLYLQHKALILSFEVLSKKMFGCRREAFCSNNFSLLLHFQRFLHPLFLPPTPLIPFPYSPSLPPSALIPPQAALISPSCSHKQYNIRVSNGKRGRQNLWNYFTPQQLADLVVIMGGTIW